MTLFLLGCHSTHLNRPLGCLMLLISFSLSVFGHQSPGQPPCLAVMRAIWSEWTQAWWPPWSLEYFIGWDVFWPQLTQSSLPAWTSRAIWSEWTRVWWPPLFRLWPPLMQSSLPTWLPWKPSDLSGLSPGSPPWLSCIFPLEITLRFFRRTVSAYGILYYGRQKKWHFSKISFFF